MASGSLSQKKCAPCEGGTKPFSKQEAETMLSQVPGWELNGAATGMSRQIKTKNFLAGVDFIKKIAGIAEAENHHPDLHLTGYRNLRIELSTHAVGGLSANDFIVASKINDLWEADKLSS